MSAQARMLSDGKRLLLNHGPIDLIIYADGHETDVAQAYHQAAEHFQTVLQCLVDELAVLRMEIPRSGLDLAGPIARRMEQAVQPHWAARVTPMAAVAGAVAEEMLKQLCRDTSLRRAYVNNGGDIALHLAEGESVTVASPSGPIVVNSRDAARGIATSGWKGRSFSLGIADSVTVLAERAADADVAATLIANAVDLEQSQKIIRKRANEISPDSDLRDRLVTIDVRPLNDVEKAEALNNGLRLAGHFLQNGTILGASLCLQGKLKNILTCYAPHRLMSA